MTDPSGILPQGASDAPATARNRDAILAVLKDHLPAEGAILEIASGTGQHAAYLAPHFAPRPWLPTDYDPQRFESIRAWTKAAETVQAPQVLDAQTNPWPVERGPAIRPAITSILCINMIHISPWTATLGLMAGAARVLAPGAVLYLYGPFKQGGRHTAPSNASFDDSLKARDPDWGVRDLEAVMDVAESQCFQHRATLEMPANNLSVVFERY